MSQLNPKSSQSHRRSWLYLGFATAMIVVLLTWAIRGVSWREVSQTLLKARVDWLIIGWGAYFLCLMLRAKRWGTLLSAGLNPGRYKTRLAATLISYGANNVLPGYACELIRVGIPSRLDQLPYEGVLATLLAERLLDIGVVFLFLLIPIWMSVLPHQADLTSLPISEIGGFLLVVWMLFLGAACYPNYVLQLVRFFSRKTYLRRFRKQMVKSSVQFLNGLSVLRKPKNCSIALTETIFIWLLNATTYWASFMALDIINPGMMGALFTQSATALAIAVPLSPGHFGAFEAGVRFSLNLFSISPSKVLAYAIVMRFVMFIMTSFIAAGVAASLGFFRSKKFDVGTTEIEKKANLL
jgi:glycosyltransferase 2 family protein